METEAEKVVEPSQDERLMAALSHAGVLLPMTGLLVPVVVWVTQKDKSAYVAFQSLQALAYHLVMIVVWFVGMACYISSFFGLFVLSVPLSTVADGSEMVEPVLGGLFALPFVLFGLLFVAWIAYFIYGLVGAVMTLRGRDFRYVVIGRRVERYLQER